MPLFYYTQSKKRIVVEDVPIATPGNEGAVHKIIGNTDLSSYCVKIYHPNKRTTRKLEKVEYMITNTPPNLLSTHYIVCWPTDIIYDHLGKFIGFIMPLAFPDSIKLYELTTLN